MILLSFDIEEFDLPREKGLDLLSSLFIFKLKFIWNFSTVEGDSPVDIL